MNQLLPMLGLEQLYEKKCKSKDTHCRTQAAEGLFFLTERMNLCNDYLIIIVIITIIEVTHGPVQ